MKLSKLAVTVPLLFSSLAFAKPPEPEPGKRWVINHAFSDEFNASKLDKSKWRDKHRTWRGRPPAMFDPSTVSVKNGNLQIKNKMLDKPKGKFTIAGGAVQSLEPTAYHGYYESRFKASRLNMSTTFWLSSHGSYPLEGKNYLGEECEQDSWSMELDIAEAVGGVIEQPFGVNFRNGMQYNTHVWYSGCDPNSKGRKRFSKGANVAEGDGSQVANNKLPNDEEVWQNFNTYAAWWKNENEVVYYLNDNFAGKTVVDTTLLENPYRKPMQMQMVTETYHWARPLPTPEQLADDSINTSYYDWVRSYYYADVDENVKQALSVKGKSEDIFNETAIVKSTQLVRNKLRFSYLYESDQDVSVNLILTKDQKTLVNKKVKLKAGYGHVEDTFELAYAAEFDKANLSIRLIDKNGQVLSESEPYQLALNVK